MKKSIIILLIIILFNSLNAEIIKNLGLKTGICYAIQNHDYGLFDLDSKYKVGFDLGIFLESTRIKKISFLIEVHYVQKGNQFTKYFEELYPPINNSDLLVKTEYISLIFLSKLSLSLLKLHPYVFIGPRIDFLIKCKGNETDLNYVYENFESIDLGMNIGSGLEFYLSSNLNVLLEFAYSPNFTKTYTNEQHYEITGSSFEILTGFSYQFKNVIKE